MILTDTLHQKLLNSEIVNNLMKDKVLKLDNSEFVDWNACFSKGLYSGALKRQSVRAKTALVFGGAVHAAMEAHLKGFETREQKMFARRYAEEEGLAEVADEKRNLDTLDNLIDTYEEDYMIRSDKFNVLALDGEPVVERSFSIPLGTIYCQAADESFPVQVIWQGRIDAIVVDEFDGSLWVLDHKTTSMMGAQYTADKERSNQMLGYTWAMRELMKAIDPVIKEKSSSANLNKVRGVIINALQLKKASYAFKRFSIPYAEWQIDEWQDEVLLSCQNLMDNLIYSIQNKVMVPNRESCCTKYGKCKFFDVCNVNPQVREQVLYNESNFVESNWSPLN